MRIIQQSFQEEDVSFDEIGLSVRRIFLSVIGKFDQGGSFKEMEYDCYDPINGPEP